MSAASDRFVLSIRKKGELAVVSVFVGFCLVAVLFPVYWTVVSSLKPYVEMFSWPPTFLPGDPTIQNYAKTIEGTFPKTMLNSIVVAFVSTALAVVLGVPAAYAFNRFRFRFSRIVFFLILAIRMFPAISLMVPMYLMFRAFGMYNTKVALVISYLTFELPFVIWMVQSFFDGIPRDLEEAGRIDGCSRFSVLTRIVLPLAAPGITVAAIFSAIMAWNEFPYALVLTSTAVAKTAPVSIAETITSYQIYWGQMSASGVMLIAPVLAFSLFVQRHMVKALVSGAVKG